MGEVFKVAKFKLRLSNRKKHTLKQILIKFTNASAKVLELLEPIIPQIEYESIEIKTSKSGKERLVINPSIIKSAVVDIVHNSEYATYRRRESIIEDVTNSLHSYVALRLEEASPSYPIISRYNDKDYNEKLFNEILSQLVACGISEDGIEKDAHEKTTDLAGKLSKVSNNKLLPYSFLRNRDFQIIEKLGEDGKPTKIALLNIFSEESGKVFLSKHHRSKPTFEGRCLSANQQIKSSSVTKLPCVLEWSLYHELNYFRIGSPKTAKLIYHPKDDSFYLHVTFEIISHIDAEGKLHYVKKRFDSEATRIAEESLDENKKKKINSCYDALTGEYLDIVSFNKTTVTKSRETSSFMGIDLGRTILASYAVVRDGTVLHKGFAESESISKRLYALYDEIANKQSEGKQLKKSLNDLYKKLMNATKNSVHRTANKIVWASEYYNAQLILENLDGLKKLPKKKVQQYKRISDLLTYKLQLKGFPLVSFNPPKSYYEIKPALTSKMCSKCGFVHEQNRNMKVSQKDFKCVACGFESNADLNASINIARLGEFRFKYNKEFPNLYPEFDDYLIKVANCKNANYSTYFEVLKRRKLLRELVALLNKRIKSLSIEKKDIVL